MNRAAIYVCIFSLAILGAPAQAGEKLHHNEKAIQKANAGVTKMNKKLADIKADAMDLSIEFEPKGATTSRYH